MVRLERSLSISSNGKQSPTSSGSPPTSRTKSMSKHERERRVSRSSRKDNAQVPGRVRVSVRLRPRNSEELRNDADFADYVELMPELKRLKLRKNNWDCDTYQFDDILNETASQKRVYEVVAKPVVESVLEGYNGTVMAYGQTGTGKTFTLGKLGEEDVAERGIMVRALEDILSNISPVDHDTVTVSYLQLYMENVHDLLTPGKENLTVVEDPKTGDVSLPGATSVEIRDHESFLHLLKVGESNRIAANTKMNTESSRSHALLLVSVKKSIKVKQDRELMVLDENGSNPKTSKDSKGYGVSMIRQSKLLIVDLAGSERIHKSGSDGLLLEEAKFINLSLTSLGKCINALAEGSPHVPIRDSKLTRLLRDSFGGTARTSLVITIGPSPQHRGETTSTILFGQRAMKVENMLKLKEEFDYQTLSKKLQMDVDRLTSDNERLRKGMLVVESEMQRKVAQAHLCMKEAEKQLQALKEHTATEERRLQRETKETLRKLEQEHVELENELKDLRISLKTEKESAISGKEMFMENDRPSKQKELEVCIEKYQSEITEMTHKFEAERVHREALERRLENIENGVKGEATFKVESKEKLLELSRKLEKATRLRETSEREMMEWKSQNKMALKKEDAGLADELISLKKELAEQVLQKEELENEIKYLKQQVLQESCDTYETRKLGERELTKTGSDSPNKANKHLRETINGQRVTIGKLFEKVGLDKILALLESDDVDIRVHAVKVVANLAAEESNQDKIVAAGGLSSLLKLLRSSEDETIRRVAAGAIANLAMNETNQELITTQSGIKLLSSMANAAIDPQTMRMVAGAIANLCGNDKLQIKLREEGGIKALLGMARSEHPDVLAQIARGIANFAKCESRVVAQGQKTGKSLLIEDGALTWLVANAATEVSPVRRHIELALCHLAQHEVNADDLVAAGALAEIVRISEKCSREDIRSLAKRTITASPTFRSQPITHYKLNL